MLSTLSSLQQYGEREENYRFRCYDYSFCNHVIAHESEHSNRNTITTGIKYERAYQFRSQEKRKENEGAGARAENLRTQKMMS